MSEHKPYGVIVVALERTRDAGLVLRPARDFARAFGSTLVLVRSAKDVAPIPEPQGGVTGVALAGRPTAPELGGMSAVPYPAPGTVTPGGLVDTSSYAQSDDAPHHIRNTEDVNATGDLNIIGNNLREEGFTILESDAAEDFATDVVHEARQHNAGLIILAAYEHGGFEKLFFGDPSDKILREAPCPVLIVRSDR